LVAVAASLLGWRLGWRLSLYANWVNGTKERREAEKKEERIFIHLKKKE
jgi:hypothetical protein